MPFYYQMKFKPILDVGSSALVVKVPIPFGMFTHYVLVVHLSLTSGRENFKNLEVLLLEDACPYSAVYPPFIFSLACTSFALSLLSLFFFLGPFLNCVFELCCLRVALYTRAKSNQA